MRLTAFDPINKIIFWGVDNKKEIKFLLYGNNY